MLSRLSCYDYLFDHTFALRPESYKERYPSWPGLVGLELEMLPLRESPKETPQPVPQSVPLVGKNGLFENLRIFSQEQNWRLKEEPSEDGPLILQVVTETGDSLSFEPGGQFEISTIPYPCLTEALSRLKDLQETLDRFSERSGFVLHQVGMNPWRTVEEIGLMMRKKRYLAMDTFFSQTTPIAKRMMRQTCTLQVCLDFGSTEEVLVKRYLGAQFIAPFSTAIFASSSMVDGKKTPYKSYRSLVWRELEPSRTGIPSQLLSLNELPSKKECVEAYLDFALSARVIFVEPLNYEVPSEPLTFLQWMERGYKGVYPTHSDFLTHLSLLFPEVRPKGYMELRSVDCPKREWQSVPPAFFSGLLYDKTSLDCVVEMALPRLSEIPELLTLSCHGLDHPVMKEGAKKLMMLAMEGLRRLPNCFRGDSVEKTLVEFYHHFTEQGRTPNP